MMPVPLTVRPVEDADIPHLVSLWQAAGLLVNPLNDPVSDIRLCRESGHGTLLVGLLPEGALAASVMVGHDGHRGWIYYMAVTPALQGQGLGRRMNVAAERWLRERRIPKVELMVRPSNARAVGFYQRLGYVPEQRALLAKRLDGQPVPLGGSRSDAPVVVTFLELRKRPHLPRIEPHARKLALLRAEVPTVSFYRWLYDAVGRDWFWIDRKRLSDSELSGIIQDARVAVYVLYADGVPAGFFELDHRPAPDVNLAYFGVIPEFIGRRMGPYMLANAIEMAFQNEPRRLTVNTCTLDHPKALPLYQRFGFQVYDRREAPGPGQEA